MDKTPEEHKIEKEIMDLIEFWETIYYQKENENGA